VTVEPLPLHRIRPLPPKWDGVPVEWTAWRLDRTTIAYHAPADQLVCGKCGTVDESMHAMGKRLPPEGEMVRSTETRKLKSGRTYEREVWVPAWPVYDLFASRCRHCGHDAVTDQRTGDAWDLDESDYGPDGSNEVKDTLW
jgi:hypothetical protein